MIFSKAWGYAIRALLYLYEHADQAPILSSVIADEESIPAPFLAKILGTLAAAGIVESTRGRKGGFILSADLKKLTLNDIASLFEHPATTGACILGYGKCHDNEHCPIHQHWSEPKRQIDRFLKNTTLADICRILPSEQRKILEEKSRDDKVD